MNKAKILHIDEASLDKSADQIFAELKQRFANCIDKSSGSVTVLIKGKKLGSYHFNR